MKSPIATADDYVFSDRDAAQAKQIALRLINACPDGVQLDVRLVALCTVVAMEIKTKPLEVRGQLVDFVSNVINGMVNAGVQ